MLLSFSSYLQLFLVPANKILFGQWLDLKLFGITYLVGKIYKPFKLLFQGPHVRSRDTSPPHLGASDRVSNQAMMDEQMFGVKPVEDGIVALARRNFRFWNRTNCEFSTHG